MGLISKITGHSSSSDKNVNHDSTTSFQQADRLDERTGTSTGTTSTTGARGGTAEHAAEKATGRDLNHDGNVGKSVHGTTSTTGAHGGAVTHAAEKATGRDLNHDGNVGKGVHGTHSGTVGSNTDRMGNLSVNDSTTTGSRGGTATHAAEKVTGRDLNHDGNVGGQGEHRVQHAAPIIQERIHDQYEHVDKERREEIHHKTRVEQVVQPVYDERQEAVTRERVDHGLEVHEHGEKGLTREAEAELARKREQIAREHTHTRDETTTQTNARTSAEVETRVHKIEEVVPVLERDIYRPHEIVHDKRVLHIHHDGVDGVQTRVNEPVSIKEFERQHGTALNTTSSSGSHGGALERGAEKVTGRDLNHDGNVGNSHNIGGTHSGVTGHNSGATSYTNTTSSTGNHGGALERGAEKATGRDLNHDGNVGNSHNIGGTHSGATGYNSTSTTGNHGGALERGAEKATGRDLNHDGNVGHNTGVTGHNTSATGSRGGAAEHIAEKATGRDLNHDGNVGKGQQFAGGHVLPNSNQQRQL